MQYEVVQQDLHENAPQLIPGKKEVDEDPNDLDEIVPSSSPALLQIAVVSLAQKILMKKPKTDKTEPQE